MLSILVCIYKILFFFFVGYGREDCEKSILSSLTSHLMEVIYWF